MNKIFKNKLAIEGSFTLKKAFIEELISLGYQKNIDSYSVEEDYIQVNQYGGNGMYSCHSNPIHGNHPNVTILKLPKDWDLALKLASEIESIKPEVGKWYILTHNPNKIFCCTSVNEIGVVYGYGFSDGQWVEKLDHNGITCICNEEAFKYARPATNEEVQKALIEEAKRRYSVPCNIYYLDGVEGTLRGYYLYYSSKSNTLYATGGSYDIVFQNGKWAKPYGIKVNGYTVTKIDNNNVKVGCMTFEINHLKSLYNFIKNYGGIYETDGKKWKGSDILKVIEEFEKA